MISSDGHDLERFVHAQNPVYDNVVRELRAGRKRTHWMWFVFPQVAGLGSSEMARRFAIASTQEAAAYLVHPVLGARLRECTQLVNAIQGQSISSMFGAPDDQKFFSSMTLFAATAGADDGEPFTSALDRYFRGERDQRTCAFMERKT